MNGSGFLDRYRATLNGLARKDRLRTLSSRSGLDFASNDYLGLARCKRMAEAVAAALAAGTPVGATGSRLLRGNDAEHETLEAKAAKFFGAERALFFGGGYVANFAVLTTLPQKGDLVVLDELIHASAHEGARAGRAEVTLAPHNDANAMHDAIRSW
ncbi:aminotransferase class I/II-fold pyridoxal phosphate-dependent enzyme, partial [Mesorhizobium sp. M4A.F.Ca.ET.050.02.1.1]|uniref:aminotransferase class I/II-fold pyridoxal phosphate-dependent enzyme n=1 Tax=Mesorhizobium sp. M4A.F.Ca.ET.050.02.1.1 TaxID=2496754 RepID=UPI000FCC5D61